MIKVAITGGHDKTTPGKRSPDGKYLEYYWNDIRAKLLMDAVNAVSGMEAKIFDDPTGAKDPPLSTIMTRVNNYKPQVFFDLHSNAASTSTWVDNARGVSIYCRTGDTDSHRFGETVGKALCAATGLRYRGTSETNWERIYGCNVLPCRNRTPLSLLIEWGFHTSRPDIAIMTNPELNAKGVKAITDVVWQHFNGGTLPEERPLLRRGSSGDGVKTLQAALLSNGFNPGPIDGIFGPRTEAAVRRFQQVVMGPNYVDGVVGPLTWAALLPEKQNP